MKNTGFEQIKKELIAQRQWLVEKIADGVSEERIAHLIANVREELEETAWELSYKDRTQQNNALKLVREFGYTEVEANCEKAVAKRILDHAGMLCDG